MSSPLSDTEPAAIDATLLALVAERAELLDRVASVEAVRLAITNEGPMPVAHRSIMARHRREWPTLWRALDALLAASPAEESAP